MTCDASLYFLTGCEDVGTTGVAKTILLRQVFSIFCRYIVLAVFYEVSEHGMGIRASEIESRTHLKMNFILHNWMLLSSFHEARSIVFIYVLRLDEPHE